MIKRNDAFNSWSRFILYSCWPYPKWVWIDCTKCRQAWLFWNLIVWLKKFIDYLKHFFSTFYKCILLWALYTFLGVFGPLLDRRRPLVSHKLWAEWGPGRTTCALGTFLLRLKSTLQQLYYALPFPVITKSTYSRLPEHGLTKMTSKLNLQEV